VEELLRLDGLRLAAGGRELLTDGAWRVVRGDRWALWGPNGAGKSTLLEVLAGERTPDEGASRRLPGLRVRHVDQRARLPDAHDLDGALRAALRGVREAEQALREEERRLAEGGGDLTRYGRLQEAFEGAGGYRAEAALRRELAQLLPGRADDVPLAALSDGERRRLALALALAERPDLLLLDEPSNALDAPSRRWLIRRLRAAPASAALVVASHDRELLGRVSTASARLSDGRLEPVRMPFDRDRERRGQDRRAAARRARQARRERARLQASAQRARRHGSSARVAAAKALERRAARLAPVAPSEPTASEPWALAGGRQGAAGPILRARHLRAPGRFDDLALDVETGAKLVLLGPNGTGKSTLLAMLAAERSGGRPDARCWLRPGARLHHWDARRRGLADAPVDAQLRAWAPEARVPSLLRLVGLPHERWTARPAELSGGERARAALALLIAREPDVVLLDEPEADLDLPAIELLEQALIEARVTVVLVTHDLRLAEAVADEALGLEDGQLVAWRGGVEGWRHGRRRREAPRAVALPDEEDARAPREGADVEALEREQAAIEARLEDPTVLTSRERERLDARRYELIAARMAAYDARLPPPPPRYRAVEPPLRLAADADPREGLRFVAPDWPAVPRLRPVGDVVHLVLPEPAGGCWTGWARSAALRASLALVFPLLAPAAVQVAAPGEPVAPPTPFVELEAGWWVATRPAWERWAGVVAAARPEVASA
jgi:ATP-binding cassette subfamily F protein 3